MSTSQHVDAFLSAYPDPVQGTASAARALLKSMLPGIAETVDESAKLSATAMVRGTREFSLP